jgi:hypothetical protein
MKLVASTKVVVCTSWPSWQVVGDQFPGSLMAGVIPAVGLLWDDAVTREFRANTDDTMAHLGKVSVDHLHLV